MINTILPPLPPEAKCTSCRCSQATIRMAHHNASFCSECFVRYFERAIRVGMKKLSIGTDIPLLVAVSGGKDSLALWNVLNDLGYKTKGLHVSLGIDEFSDASIQAIKNFAEKRNLSWAHYSLEDVLGYSIPEIRRKTRRKICSVCGFLKRQFLNRLTLKEGFQYIATGHNLDDEAGRLLGNTLRHRNEFLQKQYPLLPSTHPKMPSKVKPLYRVEAYEIRHYCRLKEIYPLEAKCPLSRGATSHVVKEALDFIESKMPGTKRDFLYTYIDRRQPPTDRKSFGTCLTCGEPTFEDLCSVCNLLSQLEGKTKSS